MGIGSAFVKSIKGAFKPNKLGPIGGIKDAFKKKETKPVAAAPPAAKTGAVKVKAAPAMSFGKKRIGAATK